MLEKGLAVRSTLMSDLFTWPPWDRVASDPRLGAIVKKMDVKR